MFRWRRANGTLAVRAVRELLVRLDAADIIRLPKPRRAQGQPRRETRGAAVRPTAVVVDDTSLSPSGLSPATRRSRLLVRPIRADELANWRTQVERFHYLGDAPLVGESIRYAAYLDGELAALLSWGSASLHNGPRERYVGWDEKARKANLHRVVNNARFLILPSCRRPHLASRVLATNLRRLNRDWEQRYGHDVVLAESFVDTSRFRGTCYRASNWTCVGETQGWAKAGAAFHYHGQPKSVWLYTLRRDFQEQLCTVALACSRRKRMMKIDMEKLPLDGGGGLFEILQNIPEHRKPRGLRHKMEGVLALAICSTLAGARSMTAIAEWAAEQSRELLLQIGCKRGKPPSERTFRRVFSNVDVEELDRCTGSWMAEQQRLLAGTGLALDGKVVRGSRDGDEGALQLLSAIVHGSGTVVAQVAIESKTNEIPKVKPLLDGLDIKGMVVTADALHTQTKTARYLVEEKEAEYVFTAKGNQPTLRKDISELFAFEEQEEKRLQRAHNEPSETKAFPPTAPDHREGPRTVGDTGDLDEH